MSRHNHGPAYYTAHEDSALDLVGVIMAAIILMAVLIAIVGLSVYFIAVGLVLAFTIMELRK